MGPIRVGTSGFSYPHWRGVFYPEGLPARLWLAHYAQAFSTVELNAPFYRLPTAAAVERWREGTPPGFIFACKASRYLTHLKRLTDTGPGVKRYFDLIGGLGRKLGPVLWQLPPQMKHPDVPRLDAFLARLPRDVRHVFEFRADGWYTDEVAHTLERHRAAFCEHDLVARPVPSFTGGFRYLRFHGQSAHAGHYGRRALAKVAENLLRWLGRGRTAFVYFNNDVGGHAVRDAADLIDLLGEAGRPYQPAAVPFESPAFP